MNTTCWHRTHTHRAHTHTHTHTPTRMPFLSLNRMLCCILSECVRLGNGRGNRKLYVKTILIGIYFRVLAYTWHLQKDWENIAHNTDIRIQTHLLTLTHTVKL